LYNSKSLLAIWLKSTDKYRMQVCVGHDPVKPWHLQSSDKLSRTIYRKRKIMH
jgi:hypothetical protein